jgi:hypothetical protein
MPWSVSSGQAAVLLPVSVQATAEVNSRFNGCFRYSERTEGEVGKKEEGINLQRKAHDRSSGQGRKNGMRRWMMNIEQYRDQGEQDRIKTKSGKMCAKFRV